MTDNSKKSQAIRLLAEYESESAVTSRTKLIDEHNAAFRWMIASLFALNGGAIAALFNSDKVTIANLSQSLPIFFGGIVLTFIMGWFGQLSDRAMIKQVHSWGLYWRTVAATLVRDESEEKNIKTAINSAERKGRFARIAGLLAMLAFIVGGLKAGSTMLNAPYSSASSQQVSQIK